MACTFLKLYLGHFRGVLWNISSLEITFGTVHIVKLYVPNVRINYSYSSLVRKPLQSRKGWAAIATQFSSEIVFSLCHKWSRTPSFTRGPMHVRCLGGRCVREQRTGWAATRSVWPTRWAPCMFRNRTWPHTAFVKKKKTRIKDPTLW